MKVVRWLHCALPAIEPVVGMGKLAGTSRESRCALVSVVPETYHQERPSVLSDVSG